MPKREYTGPAVDATYQSISEAQRGETVAGTTEDDYYDEETDVLPSFLEDEGPTDVEKRVIQAKILHPDWKLKRLSDYLGINKTTVSPFLAEFRREYEDELREANLYEKMRFPNSPKGGGEDHSESPEEQKEQVRAYFRQNPDATSTDVLADLDVSLSSDQIGGIKGSMTQRGVLPGGDDPDAGDDASTSGEPSGKGSAFEFGGIAERLEMYARNYDGDAGDYPPMKQVAVLLDAINDLESEVDRLRAGVETAPVVDGIDDDTLLDIVSGDDLSREQRREIFDAVSGGGSDG